LIASEDPGTLGRLLPLQVSEKVQRQFVKCFASECLPRISPPYWGRRFSIAEHLHSSTITAALFGSRKHIFCISGRPFSKAQNKSLRPIYLCKPATAVTFLKNVHWSLGCDLYFFDRSYTWFIAAVDERISQMTEKGNFILLKGMTENSPSQS
jgi:hypothetical protein